LRGNRTGAPTGKFCVGERDIAVPLGYGLAWPVCGGRGGAGRSCSSRPPVSVLGLERYIFHPLKVMLSLRDAVDQMAAVLHDAVEDTDRDD
jgi:hypothetical protein